MSYALPFKRGVVWESSEQGAVPSGILGKTYLDSKNGQIVQVLKNTDASALAGCLTVKWEDVTNYEVDKVGASGVIQVAGIVDPTYANKGVTVPVNAAFLAVKRGRTYCIAGAVVAANGILVTDSAASNGVEGRVQNGVIAASASQVGTGPAEGFGLSMASANAGSSVVCVVDIP